MKSVVWVVLLGVAVVVLHYFALWAESRGWIYYKRRKGSPGSVGNALLQIQAIFEPGKEHVLEARLKDDEEQEVSGDPPDAGGTRGVH
ncbi:MAG: hypothetical protein WBN92_08105 [Terriglobia bacterium]